MAEDQYGNNVLLFQNEWSIKTVKERNNGVELVQFNTKEM